MPRGDGTGPMGQGPKTGKAMGHCAGFNTPGYLNSGRGLFGAGRGGMPWGGGRGRAWGGGRGRGFAQGFGRGWSPAPACDYGWDYAPQPISPEDERTYLNDQLVFLEKEIQEIKKRLAQIDEKKDKK
ncbi:MAG: DUF5320 domain-containing protein [Pseudomonadota bacterium]